METTFTSGLSILSYRDINLIPSDEVKIVQSGEWNIH